MLQNKKNEQQNQNKFIKPKIFRTYEKTVDSDMKKYKKSLNQMIQKDYEKHQFRDEQQFKERLYFDDIQIDENKLDINKDLFKQNYDDVNIYKVLEQNMIKMNLYNKNMMTIINRQKMLNCKNTQDTISNQLSSKDKLNQEQCQVREEKVQEFMKRVKQSYNDYQQVYNKKLNNKFMFQMYIKQIKKNKQNEKFNHFIYRAEYELPCTAQQYANYLNDFNQQQKNASSFQDQYKIIKKLDQFSRISYLSYKKFFLAKARDIIYHKYSNKLDDKYIDLSFSVKANEIPVRNNVIRCQIILSGYIIQQLYKNGQTYCKVYLYNESDMKSNVPFFMVKSFAVNSIRNNIEQTIKYFTN